MNPPLQPAPPREEWHFDSLPEAQHWACYYYEFALTHETIPQIMSALHQPHMINAKVTSGYADGPEKMAYKLSEAAAMLGVSTITLRRWVSRGLLRPIRVSRHFLFSRTELLRFLADNQ